MGFGVDSCDGGDVSLKLGSSVGPDIDFSVGSCVISDVGPGESLLRPLKLGVGNVVGTEVGSFVFGARVLGGRVLGALVFGALVFGARVLGARVFGARVLGAWVGFDIFCSPSVLLNFGEISCDKPLDADKVLSECIRRGVLRFLEGFATAIISNELPTAVFL